MSLFSANESREYLLYTLPSGSNIVVWFKNSENLNFLNCFLWEFCLDCCVFYYSLNCQP